MRNMTKERAGYIDRIRKAREYSDLSHEQIADKIGVSRPTYTNWEGRRGMPQKHIAIFCKITGVREKWLLGGQGPMTEMDDKFIALMKTIHDAALQAVIENLAHQWMSEKDGQ